MEITLHAANTALIHSGAEFFVRIKALQCFDFPYFSLTCEGGKAIKQKYLEASEFRSEMGMCNDFPHMLIAVTNNTLFFFCDDAEVITKLRLTL